MIGAENAHVNEGKRVLMPELPVGVPAKIHLSTDRLVVQSVERVRTLDLGGMQKK